MLSVRNAGFVFQEYTVIESVQIWSVSILRSIAFISMIEIRTPSPIANNSFFGLLHFSDAFDMIRLFAITNDLYAALPDMTYTTAPHA